MPTVDTGCKLDLSYIHANSSNTTYNPKKFNPIIMRWKEPKSTALIFSSGKIVITGTKTEESTKIAAQIFVKELEKLQIPVHFLRFRITNIVASGELPFRPPIFDNQFLPTNKMKFVDYEPELFPGLFYRTGVTIIVFRSGKIIITNAKTREQIYDAYTAFAKSINREKTATV